MNLTPSIIAFLLTPMPFFLLCGIELLRASNTDVSLSSPVLAITAPSSTILADFILPIVLDISVAGTSTISISDRSTESLIRDESIIRMPFCLSLGWNFLSDASFIIISMSGFVTTGEPINSSEIITVQFAVPPLTSAPYDGNHVTSLFSSIPAYARILPKKSMPWPPKPAITNFFPSYFFSLNLSFNVLSGYTDIISFLTHTIASLGENPQSTGHGDSISRKLNPLPCIWYLKDFSIAFFVSTRFLYASTEVLVMYDAPSREERSSATCRGYPVVLIFLPDGVVV